MPVSRAVSTARGLAGSKADRWWLRRHPKVLDLKFRDISKPDRDTAIDIYLTDEYEDVTADGNWEALFSEKPPVLTEADRKDWIARLMDVSLGSDAFFPFGDNIERAGKSGVKYVAQPGGSIRDDNVIAACDKYGMVMAFTGIRLFHH